MRVDLRLAYEASGNLIADKRFSYALACLGEGDAMAAADLLAQTLELVPHWAPAHYAHGEALLKAGDSVGAAAAYHKALQLDPRDRLGCGPRLAALGLAPLPDALPQAYVRALFDQYAERFDTELVEQLFYAAPWRLKGMLERHLGGRQVSRCLDLGCGTGLMGEACRQMTSWLAGIDIAPQMIAASAGKHVYDHLATGDLIDVLGLGDDLFDLVTAADVFVYFGDLAPLMAQIARRLADGGLLAFSCERLEQGEFALGPGLRFAHALRYLETTMQHACLDVVAIEEGRCRMEAGTGVAAYFILARRATRHPANEDAAITTTEKRIS